MEESTYFADILLPLPLPSYFTYRIPRALNGKVSEGIRVAVQFGRKKIYSGLVRRVHQKVPEKVTPKYILSLIDDYPVINQPQFIFWEWLAEYYMSTPGEVMNAALPSGLKLTSESSIVIHPEFDYEISELNEKEILLVEALINQEKVSVRKAIDITGILKILPLIKNLKDKKIILLEEELQERYTPKIESYVRLTEEFSGNEENLKQVFNDLSKRAYKQLELLVAYISLSRKQDNNAVEVKRADLIKKANSSYGILSSLERKGILEVYDKTSSRFDEITAPKDPAEIKLTDHQFLALGDIRREFDSSKVVLLHGITSSGKTEIYIKLIAEALKDNKQVLYLLPEIALTSHIINRLRKYFGSLVGVYHSRYNENERVEVWNNILNYKKSGKEVLSETPIILGARSALFLPFSDLGLIIVDEEHDTSFKQMDPSPRYNARDAAIYLGDIHKAKVLLGSATPSLESHFNVITGKYGIAKLKERYGGMEVPETIIADMRKETRNRTMRSHFTRLLLNEIKLTLENKEQAILFQNRRGFSTRLECESCHWIPQCINCDISLTYHKFDNKLKCHYCGFAMELPGTCHDCGSTRLITRGFGTEKVEEELKIIFPEANIRRMDLDTTRTKHGHHNILEDFGNREIDVLAGTQMVTKGLDFEHVSIVGILNADNMINFPDFRSVERSYQLIEQVSGRAGRKHKKGKVVIQTYKVDHPVISWVLEHDYEAMASHELANRRRFKYPPFYRLISIKVKHAENKEARRAGQWLAKDLRNVFGKAVLGPEYPTVSRIRNLYIQQILIKLQKTTDLADKKVRIGEIIRNFGSRKENSKIRISVDVDPV
jgi:primosomal protein N' (replication factor Y)